MLFQSVYYGQIKNFHCHYHYIIALQREWPFNTGRERELGKWGGGWNILGPRGFEFLFIPHWQTIFNKCYKRAVFMKDNRIWVYIKYEL